MEYLGIIWRSDSQWASPLHIAPKPGGGWRPCGEFRCLNGCIKSDYCTVPHIQDFASHLSRRTIFLKVDLINGYHQIPVRAMDIPKTVVITRFGFFSGWWIRHWGIWIVSLFTWMTSLWPVSLPLSIFKTSLPFLIVLNDMASLFTQASVFLVSLR